MKTDLVRLKGRRRTLSGRSNEGRPCQCEGMKTDLVRMRNWRTDLARLKGMKTDLVSMRNWRTDLARLKGMKTDLVRMRKWRTDLARVKGMKTGLVRMRKWRTDLVRVKGWRQILSGQWWLTGMQRSPGLDLFPTTFPCKIGVEMSIAFFYRFASPPWQGLSVPFTPKSSIRQSPLLILSPVLLQINDLCSSGDGEHLLDYCFQIEC